MSSFHILAFPKMALFILTLAVEPQAQPFLPPLQGLVEHPFGSHVLQRRLLNRRSRRVTAAHIMYSKTDKCIQIVKLGSRH